MAVHLLFQFNDSNSTPHEVYWDDAAYGYIVYKADANGELQLLADGPDIANFTEPTYSAYSYCDYTTLNRFKRTAAYPYATRVEEADSTSCNFVACDLNIIPCMVGQTTDCGIQVTAETAYEAKDGTATVYAKSSNEPISYSLDGVSYQSHNVFDNLAPGLYTVYLRDAAGCEAQGNFEIEAAELEDAYNLRWLCEYTDDEGTETALKIYKANYTGEVEIAKATDSPAQITWGSQGNNIFTPLLASEMEINFISMVDFNFLEMYTTDERGFLAELVKGGVVVWKGYLLNDVYSEPYVQPPYPISARAVCGIATLKSEPFAYANGEFYTGEISLKDIINTCLGKINLEIPIYTSVDIHSAAMPVGAADDVLALATVDAELYVVDGEPLSCYEVLEAICHDFGVRIKQYAGAWHIYAPDTAYGEFIRKIYNADGTYAGNENYNNAVEITNVRQPNYRAFVNNSMGLDIKPPYKSLTSKVTYNKIENLVYDGKWERATFGPGNDSLRNWTFNTTIEGIIIDSEKAQYACFIKGQSAAGSTSNYIRSNGVRLLTSLTDQVRITFKIKVRLTDGSVRTDIATEIPLIVKVGSHYLSETGWTLTASTIKIMVNQPAATIDFDILTPAIPENGDFTIQFCRAINGNYSLKGYYVHDINAIVLLDGEPPLDDKEYTIKATGKFSYVPSALSVLHDDIVRGDNSGAIYRNILSYKKDPATEWSITGENQNLPFLNLLTERVYRQHSLPQQRITGSIKGKASIINCFTDIQNFGRTFIPVYASINDRSQQTDFELAELISATIGGSTLGIFDETFDNSFN